MSTSSSAEQQDTTSTSQVAITMSEPASSTVGGRATTEALGIDELLLLIMEKVPTQHLAKLRRVSKKWHDIISGIGYCVEPVSVNSQDLRIFPGVVTEDLRYELNFAIEINPAINSSAMILKRPVNALVALENIKNPRRLLSKWQEFITSPPITTIKLGLRDERSPALGLRGQKLRATLRDNTGIRIGLLLDTFDKMRVQALQPFLDSGKPYLALPDLPAAFFLYSGVAVVTYSEQGYNPHACPSRDDSEDEDSAGLDGEDGNDEEEENGVNGSQSRRGGRSKRSVPQILICSEGRGAVDNFQL